MSLFCRSLRPPTTDDAVERYLVSLQSRIAPDPLFRRRLRSQAINRFVAAREQQRTDSARAMTRQMGRIGRACLYASLALATSAAGALGASQEALPGDALYAVKLRIEQLRFQVTPAHLQGVLSANVLAERLEEMTRLLDAGRTADAMALQPAIAAHIEQLAAVRGRGQSRTPGVESRITCSLWTSSSRSAGSPWGSRASRMGPAAEQPWGHQRVRTRRRDHNPGDNGGANDGGQGTGAPESIGPRAGDRRAQAEADACSRPGEAPRSRGRSTWPGQSHLARCQQHRLSTSTSENGVAELSGHQETG